MPVTVQERFGRRLDATHAEVLYLIRGTNDDVAARSALLAGSSTLHNGLLREDAEVEELEGLDAYLGIVRYAAVEAQPPVEGESTFSFDTTGGTQHVVQSLATIDKYAPAGQTPPDFQGAINATRDRVEGVDLIVPVYAFSETHYFAPGFVDGAYKAAIFALTGRVNNASFRGFAAGEVLFLGAQGSQRGSQPWEITYRFAASPNKTSLTIGSITGINKKGWQYLWVLHDEQVDGAAQRLVQRPIAAYVEKVYEEGDFSTLGIGT